MPGAPLRGTARGEVLARLLDLSEGGALIVLRPPLDVGGIYDFALDLDGDVVWVQAEVRHCHPAPHGEGFQLGVAFVGVDPHDERRLRDFVASRRPRNS
jgi:c-di-GMP-binding flagellar brake protein YcgR